MSETYPVAKMYAELWGPYAVFSRPEFSNERYSYGIPTPSGLRGCLQSVFWHPSVTLIPTKLVVFNPIKRIAITRNELDTVCSARSVKQLMDEVDANKGFGTNIAVPAGKPRQQRSTSFLQDVHYGVEFEIRHNIDDRGDVYDIKKSVAIMERRLKKGQSYKTPYFGCRECTAHFGLSRYGTPPKSYYEGQTIDFGPMVYDMDYRDPDNITPYFFNCVMKDGVVEFPDIKEVMGDAAFCSP